MKRLGRRFLLLYFVISAPLGLAGLFLFGGKLWTKLAEVYEERAYQSQTAEGQQRWSFDSGTIGPLGAATRFDWSAAPSIEQGQAVLREAFERTLGRKLAYASAPQVTVVAEESLPGGVTRVVATVPAEAGFRIKVCLLLPPGTGRMPTVVLSYGVGGSILETSGYGVESYHHDMGLGLAQAGYVAVSYELRGLGRHSNDWGDPLWGGMHYDDFVGYTLVRDSCAMNVWVHDGLQVLRAIAHHARVEPGRIAFAGVSHGGQVAMYAAALEPDLVQAAVAMGSFVSFEDLYTRIHNMPGHAIPGIRALADMGDLAGLVAPRPLLIQWGELERDTRHGSLTRSSLSEFERTREIYTRLGAADAVVSHISEGAGHGFDVALAIAFLDKHL